jgi:hypothetical protein
MDQEYEVSFSKATKGYLVYANEDKGLNLYFPKGDFQNPSDPPKKLIVTVKEA